MESGKTTEGEGSYPTLTDVEARGLGYRKGLETPLVHAVNDEYSLLDNISSGWANALNTPPGD